MTACAAVPEPASVRAAGHKYKLRREMVKNVLCTVLRTETEQEFNFFCQRKVGGVLRVTSLLQDNFSISSAVRSSFPVKALKLPRCAQSGSAVMTG